MKCNLCAGSLSYPITLLLLNCLWPINLIKLREKSLRVLGNPEHPLLHRLTDNFMVTALRPTINDLFVCQNGSKCWAPIHHRIRIVSQSVFSLVCLHCQDTTCFNIFGDREFLNRPGFLASFVEPRVIQLGENPLRPFVVIRGTRCDFTIPVIGETDTLHLTRKVFAILLRDNCWMLTSVHGVLLRW